MLILKCDLCKKELSRDKDVDIRFAWTKKVDLCEDCASPVLQFLQKNKFLDKKEIKKL
ncbi:MAG: hypothetical protein US35_C0013G0024 [Parcubacteria group bacterium GW2011_GWA2_37_10]|nr:MAG: hypothetical protein US35_C0013G0024 [Parcubacteria group bacterium GW2011_GWA2_37_10]